MPELVACCASAVERPCRGSWFQASREEKQGGRCSSSGVGVCWILAMGHPAGSTGPVPGPAMEPTNMVAVRGSIPQKLCSSAAFSFLAGIA